jgi:hypothetical protein
MRHPKSDSVATRILILLHEISDQITDFAEERSEDARSLARESKSNERSREMIAQ